MTTLRMPLVAFLVSISCSSTSIQPVESDSPDPVAAITLEVYANGRDADQPPGSRVTEGESVLWTYVAVNSGTVELAEVFVVDDVWGAIACSKTALNPGEQLLCTHEATPEAGLFTSVGTASATSATGEMVTATDRSYLLVDAVGSLEPGGVPPAVCSNYLVMANPTQDSVTKVELASGRATTILVGDEPIDLVVDDGCTVAVSLNHRAASVSVVDLSVDSSTELAVRPGRNRLELSPDGRWVVVWADAQREGLGCVGGACPMGELSVIDLETRTVTDLAANLTPLAVVFAPDSSQAILSADSHLGVVTLSPGAVQVTLSAIGSGSTAEMVLGGQYAWVRKHGIDTITVVNLFSLIADVVSAGSGPTDLALGPDGSEMMVLYADSDELAVFDVDDPLVPPLSVALPPSVPLTDIQMAPSNDIVLMFGASADEITVWWRPPLDEIATWELPKPVRAVTFTPDGGAALVIHTLADVEGVEDFFTDQHVVSILDPTAGLLSFNAIIVASRPSSWAISPGGDFGVVSTEASKDVVLADFASALADIVTLSSAARFAGFLPNTGPPADDIAWVSHARDLSWISPADGTVETVSP